MNAFGQLRLQFLNSNAHIARDFQRVANRLPGDIEADGRLPIHTGIDIRVFGDQLHKSDIGNLGCVIDRQLVDGFNGDILAAHPEREGLRFAGKRAQSGVVTQLRKCCGDIKDRQPPAQQGRHAHRHAELIGTVTAQGHFGNAVDQGKPFIDSPFRQLGQRVEAGVAKQRKANDRIRIAVALADAGVFDIVRQGPQGARYDLARLIGGDVDIGAIREINGDAARPHA